MPLPTRAIQFSPSNSESSSEKAYSTEMMTMMRRLLFKLATVKTTHVQKIKKSALIIIRML